MKKILSKKIENGITLIALVITIVVLIILATVVINLSLGENSIFNRARIASQEYNNAQIAEQGSINDIYGQLMIASDGTIQNLSLTQLNDLIDARIRENQNPIGTIIARMSNGSPEGYLKCDGSWYDVNGTYSKLAEYIKSEFGSYDYFKIGDEETQAGKFKVPDLRGEFLRGTGTNGHTNQGSGANIGTHQDGTVSTSSGANSTTFYTATAYLKNESDLKTDFRTNIGVTYGTNGAISSGDIAGFKYTSRPTNTSVLYCIKY